MRNQRWVECRGSSLSFGDCCLVTNSVRSEVGIFSDGIRTIFEVATPTKDSQPNTIIIGHMAGSQGYCTNDSPMYAKCDQQAIPGDEVGPVAGSRTLMKGQRGYLVMGDVQGGMARVRRKDYSPSGRIGFKMTGPRLRLRQSDGTRYGTATAIVEWIVGDVPVSLGDQVTVNFGGIRWAEAVKNCEGEADYFPSYSTPEGIVTEDIYVVTECQGLPLRIAFEITEDRDPFTPDQDVQAVPIREYGASQDDLPIADWDLSPTSSCGTFRFDCHDPDPNNPVFNQQGERVGIWRLLEACGEGCTAGQIEQIIGQQCVLGRPEQSASCSGSDPQQQVPKFYVRYPQLTFPRALKGADGHAILDNAAWSDDPADMRYVVVESNQQSTRIKGTLPDDNCGFNFSATDAEVCDHWPFSQKPKLPRAISNTHKGFSGYWWWASWNETQQAYEVRDMKKTTMTVGSVGSSTDEQGCTTIVSTTREVDLETCKQPTSKVLLTYKTHTQKFVKKLRYEKNQVTTGSGQEEVTTCQPVLYIEYDQANVLALCSQVSSGEDYINLAVEQVVRQIVGADGCLYQVFTELIVWGQCGGDTPDEDPLLCVAPWECPDGSGSGQ